MAKADRTSLQGRGDAGIDAACRDGGMAADALAAGALRSSLCSFAASVVAAANAARRPYDVDRCCDEAIIAFQAYHSSLSRSEPGPPEDWRAMMRAALHAALRAPGLPARPSDHRS